MKRTIALTAILALGTALSAAAQPSTAPAGPAKVAVIAFQAAVAQTNEFQRDFADLQKKFDPQREKLKTLGTEIEALQKEVQNDKEGAPGAASRAKSLDSKQKEGKRLAEDAQNDFQRDMQQLFGDVAAKVGKVLSGYAQQNGYTMVVDVTEKQQQSQIVLYASPSADITKAIIEGYNVKSGVPAPPAPAAAAPKPAAH